MPKWRWEGINREGIKIEGEDDVKNERELKKILHYKNIRPTKIIPPSLFDLDLVLMLTDAGLISPFGQKDLLRFTKQFAVLVSAGIPILQGLEILHKQEKNIALKLVLKRISQAVGGGKSIAEAMSVEKGFDRLYYNLVRAGEVSGALETVLKKIVMHMEQSQKIRSQVKGALTYPIIVLIVGILVVAMLLVFVIPQFIGMLKSTGQAIPFVTQFVIDLSFFLQENGILLLIATIIFATAFRYVIKTPEGKKYFDEIVMHVPLFGNLIIKGNLASFSRTLATMLSSGIALVEALDVCTRVTDNVVIAKDLMKTKKQVEEGRALAAPLSKIPYFPDMVAQMVRVGEQTGALDQMFERIADIFEKDVEEAVNGMTKLIEPLILVVLGGVIGGILIAMYLPMFMSAGVGG